MHSEIISYRYEVFNYQGGRGPADKGDLIGPPNSLGVEWPTGFSGGGWAVRDTLTGRIIFAHAWRKFCLDHVAEEIENSHAHDLAELLYGVQ